LPAIQALKSNKNKIIAVSHQFVAQLIELGLEDKKIFFKAETNNDLVKLGKSLIDQGYYEFTYVCYPYQPCQPPKYSPTNRTFNKGTNQFRIKLSKFGEFGKYPIYDALILEQSSGD